MHMCIKVWGHACCNIQRILHRTSVGGGGGGGGGFIIAGVHRPVVRLHNGHLNPDGHVPAPV